MLIFTRRLLATLRILNWAAALLFIAVLVATTVRVPALESELARAHPTDVAGIRIFVQAAMLIGLATVACAHVIFARLIAMVDTVIAGHPFLTANARRLNDTAWALLGIQILDLGFGALALLILRRTGETMPYTLGITGWLAVLLLFVLARVFGEGARMQDEIEGTV